MSNSDQHPRIFLAGCGYTGERCADFFSAEGAEVCALVSSEASASRLAAKAYRVIAADASSPEQLRALLGGGYGRPDVLIHCLSGRQGREASAYRLTYVETLRHLLDVLQPAFCVFTSSTSVYAQNDGSVVTEESPAGGTPTGDVLVEAEQIAISAGGAAVRLGGIYGPGRTRFIQASMAGQPMPHGSPDAFSNLIHRDDAARALQHVACRRLVGAFNAVDNLSARRGDLGEAIRRGSLEAIPHPDTARPATGKRVNNAKLRATGWEPRYATVLEALRHDPELLEADGRPL